MQEPTSPGSTSSSNHSPDVQNKVPLRGEVASVQVFEMLPGQLQLEEMIAHKLERFTTILESLDPDGCGFSSCEQFSRACKALPWCRSSPMPPLAAIHELFDRLANPDSLVENDGTILGQLLQMRADARRRASMALPAADEEEEYRAFLLSQERAARRAKHQQQSRAAGSVSDGLEESGAAVVSSTYSGLATLKQLMGKVAQEAKTHFRCARCTVYVCDHKAGELWSLVAQGVDDTIRIPIGSGVAGACALSGRKVNVKDALSDSRVRHDLYDFELRTVLCLPILAQGARRAIGVLQLLNKVEDPAARLQQMLRKEEPSRGSHRAVTPCSFTAEDEEDVRGFCQIVGAALQSTGTSKTPDHMAPGGLALRLLMGSGVGLMAAHSMTQRRSSLLSNAFKGSGDESRGGGGGSSCGSAGATPRSQGCGGWDTAARGSPGSAAHSRRADKSSASGHRLHQQQQQQQHSEHRVDQPTAGEDERVARRRPRRGFASRRRTPSTPQQTAEACGAEGKGLDRARGRLGQLGLRRAGPNVAAWA